MDYEESVKVYRDNVNVIQSSYIDGQKEGENKKAIEIAKKAILKGMDNETIKELTDLAIEEIEAIRNIM